MKETKRERRTGTHAAGRLHGGCGKHTRETTGRLYASNGKQTKEEDNVYLHSGSDARYALALQVQSAKHATTQERQPTVLFSKQCPKNPRFLCTHAEKSVAGGNLHDTGVSVVDPELEAGVRVNVDVGPLCVDGETGSYQSGGCM